MHEKFRVYQSKDHQKLCMSWIFRGNCCRFGRVKFFLLGPGKTIVANFTELSSSPLELEGWIAAEITFWSLVAPLQQLMLLSSLPTPAGSNLTLWSWQQLFWVAPSKKNYSSKSTRISTKNSGHTQFFMIFRLVHTKFLMQTPYCIRFRSNFSISWIKFHPCDN